MSMSFFGGVQNNLPSSQCLQEKRRHCIPRLSTPTPLPKISQCNAMSFIDTDDNNINSNWVNEIPTSITDQAPSELFYISQDHSLKVLSILCQGMVDNAGNRILNYSTLQWKTLGKSSNSVKPIVVEMWAEVLCHAALDHHISILPCPKASTITQATEWLDEHPIQVRMIFYLFSEPLQCKRMLPRWQLLRGQMKQVL